MKNSVVVIVLIVVILGILGFIINMNKTPQDQAREECNLHFAYVWGHSENWGEAIEKLKRDSHWEGCQQYVQQYINEEVAPSSR